ncbi:MAG: hypothetical protein QW096_13785 [Thermofilaceae archaeon]
MSNKYLLFLPYSVTIFRFGKARLVFTRIVLENTMLLPVIVMASTLSHITSLTKYLIGLFLANILLTALYEIQYVVNDVIVSKREDKPSHRIYSTNISLIVFSRLLYSVIAILCLLTLGFTKNNIALALLGLFLAFSFHNIEPIKLRRSMTFPLVRLARYSFIPLIVIGKEKLLCDVIIAYIPLLILESISGFKYNVEKYGYALPEIRYPWFYLFGIFLPLQLLLVSDWRILGGNFLLTLLSLLKNLLFRVFPLEKSLKYRNPLG